MAAAAARHHRAATHSTTQPLTRKHSTAAREDLAAVAAGPLAEYENRVAAGDLADDEHQRRILGGLERCFQEVAAYPGPQPPPGLLRRLLGGVGSRQAAPQGVYLWGAVGTGKTMLMDLFFECVSVERKKRVHFNAFMLDIHGRIHREKARVSRIHAPDQARYFEPDGTYTVRLRPHDPIPPVAREVLQESWLICFDEFQVGQLGSRSWEGSGEGKDKVNLGQSQGQVRARSKESKDSSPRRHCALVPKATVKVSSVTLCQCRGI